MVIQPQYTAIDTVIGSLSGQTIAGGKSDGVDFSSLLGLLMHGDTPAAKGSSKVPGVVIKLSGDVETDRSSDDASRSLEAQLVIRTPDGREVLLPVVISIPMNGNDSSGSPGTGVEAGDTIVITLDTCSTDIKQLLESMIHARQPDSSVKDAQLSLGEGTLTVGVFSAGRKVTVLQQAHSTRPGTGNGLTTTGAADIPVSDGSIGSPPGFEAASVSPDEFMAAATAGVSLAGGEAGRTQGRTPLHGIETIIDDISQARQTENAGNGISAVQDGAPYREVTSENLGKNIQSIKDIPQTTLFSFPPGLTGGFDSVPQQTTNQPTILFLTVSGTNPLVMQTGETSPSENRFLALINALVSSGAQVEIVLGSENGSQPVGSNTIGDISTALNDATVQGGTVETAGERAPVTVDVDTGAKKSTVSHSIHGGRIRWITAQKAGAAGQSGEVVPADSMNNVLENPESRLTGSATGSDTSSSSLADTGENRPDNPSFGIMRHSGGPGTVSSSTSKHNTPLNNPSKPPDAVYYNQVQEQITAQTRQSDDGSARFNVTIPGLNSTGNIEESGSGAQPSLPDQSVSDALKKVEPGNSRIIKTGPETERTAKAGQGSAGPERIAIDHGPVDNTTGFQTTEGTPESSDGMTIDTVQSSSSGSAVRSTVAVKNDGSSAESALTEEVRIVSELPASDRPANSVPPGGTDTGDTMLTQQNATTPLHGIGQSPVPISDEMAAVTGLNIPPMTDGEVGKTGEDTSVREVPEMNFTSKSVSGETSRNYTPVQQAVLPDDAAAISGKPDSSGSVESGRVSVDTGGNGIHARHSTHNGQSGGAAGTGYDTNQSVIHEVPPQTTNTVPSGKDTGIPDVAAARTHTLIPGQAQSMVPTVEKHTRTGREAREDRIAAESPSEKTIPAVARTAPAFGGSGNQLTQDFSGQSSNGRNMYFEIPRGLEESTSGKQGGTQNRTGTTDDTVAAFAQLDLTSDHPVNTRYYIHANPELRFGEFSPEMELEVLNSIVRQARFMIGTGKSSAYIQLEPPTLGRLKLEIMTENSKVTGKITVESHEVKQIVQNSISELREQLSQRGLKVQSFDVQVGHNSGADAWANRERAKQFDRNRRGDVFNARVATSVEKTAREPVKRAGISQSDYIDLWI